LIAVLLGATGIQALADPWQTSGFELPADLESRLRSQIPTVRSSEDLETLVSKIGRFVKLGQLQARRSGDTWIFEGTPIDTIRNVRNNLSLTFLRTKIDVATRIFIDEADDPQTYQRITQVIHETLATKGFPRPAVRLTKQSTTRGAIINADIDPGPVCLVKEIVQHVRIPPPFALDLDSDQVCDLEVIQQRIDSLQNDLVEAGYKQARFEPPQMKIDESTLTARLDVYGSVGTKIEYRILVDGKTLEVDDVIQEEDLSRIDPQFVGPDAMTSELDRVYENLGYADVEVGAPQVERPSEDKVIYTFPVQTGPRYSLNILEFEGNSVFSQSELTDIMGMSGVFSAATKYSLDDLRQGLDAIRGAYGARGYWDTIVREPRINKDREQGRVQAVITIEEGRQRRLGEFRLNGATVFRPDEIRGTLAPQTGDALDRGHLVEMERQIRALYFDSGFLYADLKTELRSTVEAEHIRTDVTVDIIESKRIKIGLIRINGLVKIEPKVVYRELEFSSGDWYVPEEIDASRRALINLGLFRTVQIGPADSRAVDDKEEIIDLEIEVREGNPGTISFGPGWSLSRGQRFGIEASYNNIGGVGRQVFARGRLSEESNQKAIGNKTLLGRSISFGYLEPYVLGLPVDGTISASAKAEADEYWSLSRAGEVALTHRFRKSVLRGSSISTFYGQKISAVYLDPKRDQVEDAPAQVRVGQLGIRFRMDRRDQISWPTKGFFLRTETAWARFPLGGDLRYFFYEVENNYFHKVSRNWVMAIGGNIAAYTDVATRSSDIRTLPLNERLSIEGTTMVRGFQENSLGPKIQFAADSIGNVSEDKLAKGSHLAVFHLEFRRQIVPDTFAAAIFADCGNVFFSKSEERYFDDPSSKLVDNAPYEFTDILSHPEYLWTKNYTSWGLALNYLTPIGSVNLAYGLPWNRCVGPGGTCVIPRGKRSDYHFMSGQFHINVGATF
jgi:outer membrane protein assembly complex protein YaeT